MLQKFLLSRKPWQKILFHAITFTLLCIATLGFLLCIGAFFIVRIDTPEYVLIPLTTSLLAFSSFLDSFILAKLFKENGMLIGLVVSLIFIALIMTAAVVYKTFALSSLLATKLCAIAFAGILGGILGVNS